MLKTSGLRHYQNQAFAIVNSLQSRLQAVGLSVASLWQWALQMFNVSSRKELTERQWAILAARLFAAQHNLHLFKHLCDTIRDAVSTCRVYRLDSEGVRKKVYDGVVPDDVVKRCEKHADETGCVVHLHNADGKDGLRVFTPVKKDGSNMPPIAYIHGKKAERIFEVHYQKNACHPKYIEIPFPDTSRLREWCQQYVADYGIGLVVSDRHAQERIMEFDVDG